MGRSASQAMLSAEPRIASWRVSGRQSGGVRAMARAILGWVRICTDYTSQGTAYQAPKFPEPQLLA
ncbi:MAG: hypothetical protein ABIV47_05355 [Roseiflexaceae bacterium]